MKMSNELKENTVQHTLCMPLCGRMIAAQEYPDLFPDRDAERIVRELGGGYIRQGHVPAPIYVDELPHPAI